MENKQLQEKQKTEYCNRLKKDLKFTLLLIRNNIKKALIKTGRTTSQQALTDVLYDVKEHQAF